MRITWLGHSTVLLETAGGQRLLTDPVLRGRIAHIRRQAPPAAAPGRVDAVLLSHLHHDHLDLPSLRALGAPVLGPRGTAAAVRRTPVEVRELGPGEERALGATRVRAVPAVHDGRRWPHQRRRADDALGFVLEDPGPPAVRAYFAGDTELFGAMAKLGPLDVALVPIWGWGSSVGRGHMDPEQAARSLALLRPAVAVPIHWGTLLRIGLERRNRHLLREPVDAFARHAARLAPDVPVEVLEPGGVLDVPYTLTDRIPASS